MADRPTAPLPLKALAPRLLLIALAYYLSGLLGLTLASWGTQVTLIWPPTGIALFALLVWGPRMTPAIWLAAALVNLHMDSSPAGAVVIATGNTAGPLLAALALRRLGFDHAFQHARDVLLFTGIGALAGMAVSASVGTATLVFDNVLPAGVASQVWLTWWLGDALGVLVVGPALLALATPAVAPTPVSRTETLLTWASLIPAGLVCVSPLSPWPEGLPAFLVFPFVIWLALRQPRGHAAWAVLTLAGLATWSALAGLGPFIVPDGTVDLPRLWTFMFTLALASLLISTLRGENARTLAESRAGEARLMEAEAIARLGSWELDLTSGRLTWSPEIFRLFELDPGHFDASYEAFLAAIHPEDRDRVNRAYTESVANRAPYAIVHRLRMADGRIKHVEERCHTDYAPDGTPLRSVGTVQDITELEEARQALARTESAWSEAMSHFSDPIYILDTERRLIRANQAFYAMVGGIPENLVGRHIAGILHPQGETVACPVCRAQNELRDALITLEADHPDNPAGHPMEISVQVMRDVEGRATGIMVGIHDLSRERAQRAALAESEAKFRAFADFTYDWEVWVGVDGAYRYVTPSCLRVTGHAAEEFERRPGLMLELIHPEDREGVADHFEDLTCELDDRVSLEFRILRKDGEVRWIEHLCQPVQDDAGRHLGRRACNRDITDRKLAEIELARYREQLEVQVATRTRDLESANRQLIETQYAMDRAGIAIHWVDPETGRLLYVNDRSCEMLGYSREELLARSIPDIDPNFPAGDFQALTRPFREQGYARFESTERHKDGHQIPVEVTLYYRAPDDTGSGRFIGFLTDISQRKAAEQALVEAKEAAEAANRAKSVFLSNMSHELRTPLNAILGFAQLMERDASLSETQRDNLATINRSGRHLLDLINDVLEISRIESGRAAVQNAPFDLADSLSAIEEMTRVRADAKGLDFAVARADGLPGHVHGDAPRLRQILLNLLANAVKFTDRGEVRLTVSRAGTDRLRFQVSDTGPGIAPEEQERVFQAFYQTAAGVARGEGTGLGLTISREYARMMGGRLELDSQPGTGSTFTLELPLPETDARAVAAAAERRVVRLRPGQAPVDVLVAEDNPDNRDLLVRLLENAGYATRTARNGVEAVEQCRSKRPDFVWMDMRMPGMDGYEATRRIRALPGGSEIRIAALTASAFRENRADILAAGCDDMVAKPLDAGLIFETMARLLGVEYEYEGTTGAAEALQGAPVDWAAALPTDLALRLRAAAESLDLDTAHALADRLAAHDADAAAALHALIDDFRFDDILRALAPAPA